MKWILILMFSLTACVPTPTPATATVAPTPTATVTPMPTATHASASWVVCGAKGLYVRSEPNASARKLFLLNVGDAVMFDGTPDSEWTQIVGGWVRSSYLCEEVNHD